MRQPGLDGRHRDADGRISEKHGNTKIKNLKDEYPKLKNFRNEDTLGEVRDRYGADSLDDLLRKIRANRGRGLRACGDRNTDRRLGGAWSTSARKYVRDVAGVV